MQSQPASVVTWEAQTNSEVKLFKAIVDSLVRQAEQTIAYRRQVRVSPPVTMGG